MLSTIALALTMLTTGQYQDPGAGTVRGVVRSESNHAPLKYAIVQVVGGQLTQRAVTDSSGVYVLRNVTAGIHAIRAEHLDHAPFVIEVLVPARAEVRVDLALALRPVPLPAVMAHNRLPRGGDTVAAAAPDLGAAAVRALEASPGVAELGLASNHVGAPGADPADPSDVLYVRGAAADLKLVLLDGAPVYAPFHVGGLINAFDPGVLRSATLYLGGAPARYDGGLSYVMDMETRGGRRDQVRTDGSVDMLSARALVEGPFTSSAGYMVTGRTVHGLGTSLLDSSFPYGYADGLARVDYDAGAHGSVRATGFWNQESVHLDHTKAAGSTAVWGNTAASLRYKGEFAGVDAEFTAGYGGFDATLPIGGTNPILANGLAQRVRLAADLGHSIGPIQMHYGASYDHIALHYTSRPRDGSAGKILQQTAASGEVGGIYMDGSMQAGPRIKVRGGMRADVFSRDLSAVRFGPRLAVTFMLSDRAALTFAGGQYHQYVRASEVAVLVVDSLGAPVAGPIAPLSVARASHLLVALDQDVGEGIRVGLQGFFKTYEGLPDPNASVDARNHSSGMDLWVRRSTGRLTGWVGYSLGWVWSVDPHFVTTDKFSGRQIVSAGITGPIGEHGKFDVRVGYGAGLPYTAIPENSGSKPAFTSGAAGTPLADVIPIPAKGATPPITTTPEDPYLRLDVQIAHTFETTWWSIAFKVTPYVRVLNALHSRDALFYQFDRTRDTQPKALAALPVLPIVGFEWRF